MLRAVNVSGHNRVPMADLRAIVQDLGHDAVETYLQSGNVVFTASRGTEEEIATAIHAAVLDRLGVTSPVVLRGPEELRKTVRESPFAADEPDPKKVSVVFLERTPDIPAGEPSPKARNDRFALVGRDVHLHTPDGSAGTVYGIPFWEKRFGTTGTGRNWRSVTKLLELAEAREA